MQKGRKTLDSVWLPRESTYYPTRGSETALSIRQTRCASYNATATILHFTFVIMNYIGGERDLSNTNKNGLVGLSN